jgi:hypothetical protein
MYKILMLAKLFLVLGGLNYLTTSMMNINLFAFLPGKVIGVIIGLSALYFLFNRDFYLPFLGPTVMPIIKPQVETPDMIPYTLTNLPPNTTIVYWAADKGDMVFADPISAYSNYANSGISKTDDRGNVTIKIKCPAPYKVGRFWKRQLPQHFHYRYETSYPGLFSPVFTQDFKC